MAIRFTHRTLYLFASLLLALILAQLWPAGAALASAPPRHVGQQEQQLACDATASYSNVRFNGAAVTEITVTSGGSVRMQYDFSLSNPTWCSTCRRQFLQGYELGGSRTVIGDCAYDYRPLICPSLTTGSFDYTFAAPSTPGDYGIRIAWHWDLDCSYAKPNWLANGGGDLGVHHARGRAHEHAHRHIHGHTHVHFYGHTHVHAHLYGHGHVHADAHPPVPNLPATPTSASMASPRPSISVAPGQSVRMQYNFSLSNPGWCEGCWRQFLQGYERGRVENGDRRLRLQWHAGHLPRPDHRLL